MNTGSEPPVGLHPYDAADALDPFARLARLRRECPVSDQLRAPFPPIKLVVRHEDVGRVYRDWSTFSNALGVSLDPAVAEIPDSERVIVQLDPPAHTAMRRVLLTALSPAAVEQARSYIDRVCEQVVDTFASQGRAEMVAEWAKPIPSTVITQMLGVPEADRQSFRELADRMVDILAGSLDASMLDEKVLTEVMLPFAGYVQGQIDERRALDLPPDDVITRMMGAEGHDGHPLSDFEIQKQITFLLLAGNETTTNLLSNLLWLLLREPGLYDKVRKHRELVPSAVEEALRFEPPVQYFPRLCTQAAEIAGVKIEPGEPLVLHIASANRDEKVFGATADSFDIDRSSEARHFAFGGGVHQCLGAPLARQEAISALNRLLDRIPRMALADDFTYEKVDFYMFRGLKRLPVSFEPA